MCLAVPGQIARETQQEPLRMGVVSFSGVEREVCLAYVPDAAVGDWVLVHAGFAISQVDEQAAAETWAMIEDTSASRRHDEDTSRPRTDGDTP